MGLQVANYFQDHLGVNFGEISRPLVELVKKDTPYVWTAECDAAFHEIKQRVVNNPKLYFIDYDLPIFIRCDASKQGCGAELFQVVDGFDRPVCFISKTFNETEQRWSVLEQELFSAVWAVKKWSSMLEGHHFTILTDHKNILQLAKAEAPKVVRWRLLLMAFDLLGPSRLGI